MSILVTYATKSGSTAEIAATIAEELGDAEVQPVDAVQAVDEYDAVVLGGPMILGWHGDAIAFLKQHGPALAGKPVALFITALELARRPADAYDGIPLYLDPKLGHAPQNPDRMSFKERQTSVQGYLAPILKAAPQVKPVSAAFFKGKLDYSQLGLLPKLFVRIIIRGEEGDFRDWDVIKDWAGQVKAKLAE